MENYHTTMGDLFEQLGLSGQEGDVEAFIETHKGLRQGVHIEDAEFWSKAQAEFIRNALLEDAEWAELIDQLNTRIR
ncbi:DUF2789 family protein [Paraglaciecola chathamensis]|jgi:hypothetical protein|uniref:DUF2789 domain-containing protein n=3 Tax=Paraglaciecola chathamensis TaxID=368405 RepID=A0A8H9M0B3_9ALTE|nr:MULTISPECIES: DUF2789 family protein [Paraglaciecola]AEE22104.1 hypothetical protein Glaag_1143 [Glaciecola sp. 4H-3-7+YE-5]MBN27409.1 DUF2789 domain-containing protein [Alteromonadaceae bacterium]MBJ2135389.1 DUF2789 domain-containing protein [Paraglaciecola chathamensis]MBU3016129.1 DUF2789 domain-containing protein [Paraglaciecola agarilytica]MDO6560411.1 DUF2789 family protein [Paraglaciecola chathamensis]|tara:strand:- start:288 stop:518 length:231 start_codon:yes stop_codon:yes gene_type:complete